MALLVGTSHRVEARDLPLEGITADLRVGADQMEVAVGN